MRPKNEIVKLVSTTTTVVNGRRVESTVERQVFAAISSVKRSEFYLAMSEGMTAEIMFTINVDEFLPNIDRILYQDRFSDTEKPYTIIRTYQVNENDMEIVCRRLN